MHERRSAGVAPVRAARRAALRLSVVSVLLASLVPLASLLPLASLVPLAALRAPAAAGQEQSGDLAQQREEVRRREAEVAAQLDTLRATDSQVVDALAVLQANVVAQQARVDDARRAVDDANRDLESAQRREQEAKAQLDELNTRLTAFAVDSYIRPPASDVTEAMVSGEPLQAPERQALARFRIRDLDDVIDQVRARRQDLERARAQAAAARDAADQWSAAETARLGDLDGAVTQQQGFAADVADRIDRALAESANLAAQDTQLSQQISDEQKRLAAQLAASAAGSAAWSGAARSVGSVSVTTVGGIVVNVAIAEQLGAMLAAAAADGVNLSGGGFRDPAQQIALRAQNCGSSDYAIWQMASSDCSPPTARPGSSLHEQGLAIDFSANGSLIQSRGSAGFQWLDGHAASYGFYNLPSEPWHWSVNGS
jgi:LAS superfamily LD-carboxypeptidase LdcB